MLSFFSVSPGEKFCLAGRALEQKNREKKRRFFMELEIFSEMIIHAAGNKTRKKENPSGFCRRDFHYGLVSISRILYPPFDER
jgi:hypothetical protein